ncbi:hypothetical protein [Planctomycetes bacterium CA13]|uniref:hypothetical protein n=1 Tax=Novipirellula herctigrandis TaxID=2527986 RepID=UPI0011B41191
MTQVQDTLPTLIDITNLDADSTTLEKFDGTSLAGLLTSKETSLVGRKLIVQWSAKDFPDYGQAAVLWKSRDMKTHYATWWKTVKPIVSVYSRS